MGLTDDGRERSVGVAFRVLGDVAVLDADGAPVETLTGKWTSVLALLLLRVNAVVPEAKLIEAGDWGSAADPATQVQKAVSGIRNKVLRRAFVPAEIETVRGIGYRLRVAAETVDVAAFIRAVKEADDGPPQQRIESLRRALALWSGTRPLANLPVQLCTQDGPFAGDVTNLLARRARAATKLIELTVGQQGYEGIVEEAREYAALFPIDQRLCELAMIAHYRCADLDGAIRVRETHAQAMSLAHNGRPAAQTRRLMHAILADDHGVVAEVEAALGLTPAQVRVPLRVPHELPDVPTTLIGRDGLRDEAALVLRQPTVRPPVLLITGASGSGKTALAGAVARQVAAEHYPDGVIYLSLREATGAPVDPTRSLEQCLRAVGMDRVPENRADRAREFRTRVAGRRLLLVLDDASSEEQVRDLIPGTPTCGVLVTSYHTLPGLETAQTVGPLPALTPSQSMALYLDRIRRTGDLPEADQPQTERLLAVLDGLPLAITIVAALRLSEADRPVADLVDRIERLGPRALAYGQRSVARSIGASLDRLDQPANLLFRALGALALPHVGAWTAWAVLDGIDLDDDDPYGPFAKLVSCHVLTPDGPGRYALHTLTRQYARWSADQEGVAADVAQRTYRALLTLVRRAHRGLHGGDFEVVHSGVPDWEAPASICAQVDQDPRRWFDLAAANIRAAVVHCAALGLTELCWDLAVSAHEYYTIAGRHDDWYETHTIALNACRPADRRGEAVLLTMLGQPAMVASRRAGAVSGPRQLRDALDALRECGDEHGQAIALRTLGNALRRAGRLAEPLQLFREAARLYERCGDPLGAWQAHRFTGHTHLDLGNPGEAVRVLTEALAAADRLGSGRAVAQTNYFLGQAQLASYDAGATDALEPARAAFAEVLAAAGGGRNVARGYALLGLGEIDRRRNELGAADEKLAEAVELGVDGDATLEGRAHVALAAMWAARGDTDRRIAALHEAVRCFAGGDNGYLELATLAELSRAHPVGSPAGEQAWAQVEARYRELDLPEEDRVHRPPPLR